MDYWNGLQKVCDEYSVCGLFFYTSTSGAQKKMMDIHLFVCNCFPKNEGNPSVISGDFMGDIISQNPGCSDGPFVLF